MRTRSRGGRPKGGEPMREVEKNGLIVEEEKKEEAKKMGREK